MTAFDAAVGFDSATSFDGDASPTPPAPTGLGLNVVVPPPRTEALVPAYPVRPTAGQGGVRPPTTETVVPAPYRTYPD